MEETPYVSREIEGMIVRSMGANESIGIASISGAKPTMKRKLSLPVDSDDDDNDQVKVVSKTKKSKKRLR